ncbi:MAG: hypothetical protein H6819_06695 [Phycisphaerales bacterium]|nr:hypothetical protein [Phycisphaerales bacterium]MCB9855269.1 hypothetical protein [Phycisphaerales bacterium]MCB9862862.1 hypothetical protein [Phycisphaerales bacterium]
MGHEKNRIILLGVESTPGTEASSMDMHVPFLDIGFERNIEANNAEVWSSSTFPEQTDEIAHGATAAPKLMPEVNVNTIRDLLLLAITRGAGGSITHVTIQDDGLGVSSGGVQFLGAVVVELSMRYSRQSQPDASSLLTMELSFQCMKPEQKSGISAGTPASGARFRIEDAVFTLNSVAATKVLEYSRTMRIAADLGALDADGKRLFITPGNIEQVVTLDAFFDSAAWTALILGRAEFAASVVHSTGNANENFTETMGKCKLRRHNLGSNNSTVRELIELRPKHTGAAAGTVWTFDTAIGASVLGL